MGDPVTMAVIGGTIGAATSDDPLKGALLGAAGGYAGGSLMGAGSTSPFSIGSFMNGIGTNFAAGGDPLKGAAMNAAALAGSGGGFSGGGYGSIGTSGATASGAGSGGMFSGMSNMFNNTTSTPLFGQGGIISNVNQTAGAYNQVMRALGYDQQQPMSSLGASVRQGGQSQPIDYMSLLNPQQQTVIRPATPSLI